MSRNISKSFTSVYHPERVVVLEKLQVNYFKAGVQSLVTRRWAQSPLVKTDAQGGFSFVIVIVTGGSCCPGTLISPSPRRHSTIQEAGPLELLTAVKFQS